MSKEQKILLLLIVHVGGAGASFYVTKTKASATVELPGTVTQTPSSAQVGEIVTPPSVKVPVPPSKLVVKEYTSDVSYRTPEKGNEMIHVKIALAGSLIQDVAFSYDTPTKRESSFNLSSFDKALSSQRLVGKKLSDVQLSRVGGASLTTGAFMKAIEEISAKANA